MSSLVRFETPHDEAVIATVIAAAFVSHPHSDGSEPSIVSRLRGLGELSLSLVAELEREVVGHIAFSPVSIEPAAANWYGLGPLSVLPAHQAAGIGSALVRMGLEELVRRRAKGCVVFGDAAYYSRFGFKHSSGLVYPLGPAELFHALAFEGTPPDGKVSYSAAFSAA